MQKVLVALSLGFLALFILPVEGDGKTKKPGKSCLAELKGSRASLARQNKVVDHYNLERIKSKTDLNSFIRRGILVSIPEHHYYELALENEFRFARPWVKKFLEDFSKEFFIKFGKPLKVTSLVRTRPDQLRLSAQGISDADGKSWYRQSSHLTGSALDISKRPMSKEEVNWICERFLSLKLKGVLEAVHEPHQNHFHIMVFPFLKQNTARTARCFHIPAGT